MNCTKCNTPAVKNSALGKDFWVCQQCKHEILPVEATVHTSNIPSSVINTLSEQEMYDLQKAVDDIWRSMSSTGGL